MRSRSFLLGLLVLALLAGVRWYHRYYDPNLYLTFFDVGQGDAALIQLPKGATILVDSGGGFEDWNVGSRTVFPELARLGILSLDVALLSHPDNDHAYGFLGIFQELSVKSFWFNEAFLHLEKPNPLLTRLRLSAAEHGIPVQTFSHDTILEKNGVSIHLFPLDEGKTNNRTLVLDLSFAGCSALYTGDIEKEAEEVLSRKLNSPVTILKVPHHGSITSSTEGFLRKISPRFAVISVGAWNRYGHPRREVIRRLLGHDAQLLRTDFHGFVRFKISPEGKFSCETSQGPCGEGSC